MVASEHDAEIDSFCVSIRLHYPSTHTSIYVQSHFEGPIQYGFDSLMSLFFFFFESLWRTG